jgi:dephospho-CoA kinase
MIDKPDVRLIGLTGTNGAGKGEVAAYFIRKGFAYYSLSDVLRAELSARGEAVTRDNLIRIGNALRASQGADVLARRIMAVVAGRSVIDSIRNPEEIAFFRTRPDFRLLAVDAPVEVRYERVRKRGRDESARTLDEFIAKEREEMEGSPTGQQLRRCRELADALVINDGTLENLYRKLEVFA